MIPRGSHMPDHLGNVKRMLSHISRSARFNAWGIFVPVNAYYVNSPKSNIDAITFVRAPSTRHIGFDV